MRMNLLVLSLLTCIAYEANAGDIIVDTQYGKIRGRLVHTPPSPTNSQITDVYQFTAIPYATPPVGNLRFRRTVPVQAWNRGQILDATKHPPSCVQPRGRSVTGDEDCLYLNIWVPKTALEPNQNQLSVFVFIHGGSFSTGSTMQSPYNGTILAGFNNIVVVTIQYRLGSLGFAYLGNDQVPGNMGLWDQMEALKWVSENIASFGGNSSEVTIGGQNAGSASVTSHLLSPYSRKYFQRAILQSGSVTSPRNVRTSDQARSITDVVFGNICNSTLTFPEKIQCIRWTDAAKFPFLDQIPAPMVSGNVFGPVFDGIFIPGDPNRMLHNGDYNQVPLLVGANRDEGSMFADSTPEAARILRSKSGETNQPFNWLTYENYQALIGERFRLLGEGDPLIKRAIELQYWPRGHIGTPKGIEIYKAFYAADGDYGIMCPVYHWASTVAKNGRKVYAYFFTQRRSQHWVPDYMGVMHGDELSFVFGELLAPPKELSVGSTNQEQHLSKVMMTYWSNFVKYGDPNGNLNLTLPYWPPYVGITCPEQYFELKVGNFGGINQTNPVLCELRKRVCMFWQDYMAQLVDRFAFSSSPNPVITCPKPDDNQSTIRGNVTNVNVTNGETGKSRRNSSHRSEFPALICLAMLDFFTVVYALTNSHIIAVARKL